MNSLSQNLSHNKDIASVLAVSVGILLLPLVAMQFGEEVQWTALDFITMGIMLVTTGSLLVLASRKITNAGYRFVAMSAALAAFLIVWVLAATD